MPPVLPHPPEFSAFLTLSFKDLIEIQFIEGFRRAGVPWPEIRAASRLAAELVGTSHPFSTQKFKSLGPRIVADLKQERGISSLLRVTAGQYLIPEVVKQDLRDAIDYDSEERLLRWWPCGRKGRVVVDPQRMMGQPIVANEGVPTQALYRAFKVEGDVSRVAEIYEVRESSVRSAISFEETLEAA